MTSAILSTSVESTTRPSFAQTLASFRRWLPGLELGGALLLSLIAGGLHLSLYLRHFPLWRDEVNTTQLSTLPNFADTWKFLPYDSIPLLVPVCVRTWVAVMPADHDFHLRLLGLLIGLGVLGACWLSVRTLGGKLPLLSVTLLGFNPLFIRYGDSIRGYGLGTLLAILTFAAVWRVVQEVRPRRVLLAVAVGILSVNCLFYNAVLLLGVCLAGSIVSATERNWKKAAVVLGLGLPAALSLLPYAHVFREQHRWGFLVNYTVTTSWLWERLSEVTGAPDPLGVWAWTLLFVGLIVLGARYMRNDRAIAFACLTLVLGTLGYALFLRVLNYRTQPWYYVALLGLAAACLDVLCARLLLVAGPRADRWRIARLAFVLAFSTLTFSQAREELHLRPTNLDQVAAKVAASAAPEDLIVHTRWECAITFGHYYHGATPQVTLPPLDDHRFHRYDLMLAQMQTENPLAPVIDRMSKTLQSGHRIWLVGTPALPGPHQLPPVLKPIDAGPGSHTLPGNYYVTWNMQACYFLQHHATTVEMVRLPKSEPISDYEELPLGILKGWTPSTSPKSSTD